MAPPLDKHFPFFKYDKNQLDGVLIQWLNKFEFHQLVSGGQDRNDHYLIWLYSGSDRIACVVAYDIDLRNRAMKICERTLYKKSGAFRSLMAENEYLKNMLERGEYDDSIYDPS